MKTFRLVPLLLILISPSMLMAKPIEVLIFPSGAIVTEESAEEVNAGAVTLTIPAAADPASLKVSIVGGKAVLSGLKYQSILSPKGNYQELEAQIEVAKDQAQSIEDQRKSKAMALALWSRQVGAEFTTANEVEKLGALILNSSESLYIEHSKLEKEKKAVDKRIRELEKQLSAATGQHQRVWAATVSLKGAGRTETLRYSYRVGNTTWSSNYTLNALPAEKNVLWSWTAHVRQQTAVDWENVSLLLATAEPVFTMTPPVAGSWIIRESRPYRSRPSAAKALMESSDSVAGFYEEKVAVPDSAPSRNAGALFDIYDLGQKTILAGQDYQLDIRNGAWPAKFANLARPLKSPQAFLSAKLELEELVSMPSGNAAILVEGVYVGQRGFSLLEKKFDLPFGNDPQIAIKVTPKRESDEIGILGNDRSQTWNWEIEVTNNKTVPVELRIEDVLPEIQDKRIELVQSLTPEGTQEKHLVFWEVNVPAGKQKQIDYSYTIEYPGDLAIELGR